MLSQLSLEDLGVPLSDVTFCVVDLETTGGSPQQNGITEVGAVKIRRGEVLGTFETLVNPGESVPAFIRLLTGISDAAVADAPPIEKVLPSFLEFIRGTVLVAHNARFDVGFLNAALARCSYPTLDNRVIDTAALARKTLAGEIPNNKLATLCRYLRCAHQPSHRAFIDALAATDVLHNLIERVSGFGVTTLEDLISFSYTTVDGTRSKLRLTDSLPTCPGVYRFVGAGGRVLYVGKATNVRSRVRSYFYGDPRRKIRDLLRETETIDCRTFRCTLEAEIEEARAIRSQSPPYNRAGKSKGTWYLKLALGKNPRIAAARVPKVDGSIYLGPFPARKLVVALVDALASATRLHRCNDPKKCGTSAFDQMRSCAGGQAEAQRHQIRLAANALAGDPGPVLAALQEKLRALAAQRRFEEAAELRDRAAALERALARSLDAHALIGAGEIVIQVEGRKLRIRDGRLESSEQDCGSSRNVACVRRSVRFNGIVDPAAEAEARLISSWLRRNNEGIRLVYAERPWAMPLAVGPGGRFTPVKEPGSTRGPRQETEFETSTRRSKAPAAAPASIA